MLNKKSPKKGSSCRYFMLFGADYIALSRSIGKDTKCLGKMNYLGHYNHIEKYEIPSYYKKPFVCSYNTHTKDLTISGSLPYFLQGHNVKAIGEADLKDSMLLMGEELGLNIFSFDIRQLEYGGVMQIPFHPERILNTHLSIKGSTTHRLRDGVAFWKKESKFKLYNPIVNMQRKVAPELKNEIFSSYLDKNLNYIRVENHYSRPAFTMSMERLIFSDLFNYSVITAFKKDLIKTYMSIEKTRSRALPQKKSWLTTEALIYSILLDKLESPDAIRAMLKEKLSQLPYSILNKEDRKARLKHFREITKRFSDTGSISYDLTKDLEVALGISINEK